MAKRPVHWSEGMFLKPHHFQASDRYFRERLRESEDWLHPHDWGLKDVVLDEDALANYSVVLRSCRARFKDGTTLSIPDEATVSPEPLHDALKAGPETTAYLAIPTLRPGQANIEPEPTAGGPRYLVRPGESADENTGADEEPVDFRVVQARLLLSKGDPTAPDALPPGYEVLPIARIGRSADATATPRIVGPYVPPILGLNAWRPLLGQVQSLHEQIGSWVNQESAQLVDRKVSFDNAVVGDADRLLRLSALNCAYSTFQAILPTAGLHPIEMYRELCRTLGHLSSFSNRRRPVDVPPYDHEDIGPLFAFVIEEIRKLIGGAPTATFEKRYFQFQQPFFYVQLEPNWTLDSSKLYLGIESPDLGDSECDGLLRQTAWKLGSRDQVDGIYKSGAVGLKLTPLNRIPPALPSGAVYFEIYRDPNYWVDVVKTQTLGLRFKLERGGAFVSDRILAMTIPSTGRSVNLQFAAYLIKAG